MRWPNVWNLVALAATALGTAARGAEAAPRVQWRTDFESSLADARRSQRPVLVSVGAGWCPACLRLERTTLADPGVVEVVNQLFVPVHVNADASPELARRLDASRLPVTLVLAPSGAVLGRFEGYRATDAYVIELGKLLERLPSPEPPVSGLSMPAQYQSPPLASSTAPHSPAERAPRIILSVDVEPAVGLQGYCPVSLVDGKCLVAGNRKFSAQVDGQSYWFAGAEERTRFLRDSPRYTPVRGGQCSVSRAERHEEVEGDPHYGAVYRGRLYLFAGASERGRFQANPQRYLDP